MKANEGFGGMDFRLVFGSVTPLCYASMRDDWAYEADQYLRTTCDANGWAVILKGA